MSVQVLDPRILDWVHLEWTEGSLFLICIVYAIMRDKHVTKIMDKMTDQFVYGVLVGFFLLMEGIVATQGLYATLKEYQVHYVTLMWLDAMALWFYYNRPRTMEIKKKILYTFLFTLWFFEIHDWFWLLQVQYLGYIYLSPTTIIHPDWIWFSIAYSRYIALSIPLTYLLRKQFHIDRYVLALVAVQLVYHVLVSYTDYPANFLTLIPDALPSILMVWRKKERETNG
jgi:hypothetical protein